MDPVLSDGREQPAPSPGWKTWVFAASVYLVGIAVATWPRVQGLRSTLPDRFDTYQHLWIMRWYKTCLLEGRPVFRCPEIQYPVGAPLGNFSALHLQALLYLPMSLAGMSDALCYNIIWLVGLLTTGLGTFALAWHVLRDRACAVFGGLLAMLSAPMMIHAHAHLELVHVGWFPLFLVAWMRFVDRPSRGRMALAALGYVVVAMSAAYYMVFALFPAAWYVAWRACRCPGGWRGAGTWLRGRLPWLLGYAGTALPCLLVLFSSQFWAIAHGHSLNRPRAEFDLFGAPLWSYLVPTREHLLGSLLPIDPYRSLGERAGERTAYLGVVTLALLAYAAIRRVRFREAGYVWSAFAMLVVLSLGAYWEVGSIRLSLPSAWLWSCFPVYRMTRVPGRFGLFAGVLSGVLAAAGLRHLLARLPRRGLRAAALAGLAAAAVADLATVPFWQGPIPAMPGCYAFLKGHDPEGAIVEIPHLWTGGSTLNASCTYWQALHRLRTSAGYSGHPNLIEDHRVGYNSPFLAERLADPEYLRDPSHVDFDFITRADFRDYVWLYLTINRFDYVVLHQRPGAVPEHPVRLDRLKALLRDSRIYEDADSVVYARSLLKPPSRPVAICLDDWRLRNFWEGRHNCLIPRGARLVVYNPDRDRMLTLSLDLGSVLPGHSAIVRVGDAELARWEIEPGRYRQCLSPPLRLPAGLNTLTITSEFRPSSPSPSPDPETVRRERSRRYCFLVAGVGLSQAPDDAPAVARGHRAGRVATDPVVREE